MPEHLAYQCYAQLKSLIKLAGDQKDEYETVPEADPRPKHCHLKYKLDRAEKGRTWRILKRARADDSLEPAITTARIATWARTQARPKVRARSAR